MTFGSLGLCEKLSKAIVEQGYVSPTPIQIEAIPAVLNQRDIMAAAHTGTGKTAGFVLPMLQLLSEGSSSQAQHVRALVLTPTRELAAQVNKSVQNYGRHLNTRSAVVFGGVRIEPQISQLQSGVDVLVATPGRLIDLYNQQAINFEQLEILVLDEADRMLDLGFIDDIRRIQKLLPVQRQNLMFSATFSQEIKLFAKDMLHYPALIEVTAVNSTVDTVKQKIHPVDKTRKSELLIHLIKKHKWHQLLVFSRTKHGADGLVVQLKNAGVSADSIHANRTQHARVQALDGFKSGRVMVLVATDIASRGIDVEQLPCVVNFDLPYVPEDYVHRIGRTGRASALGLAISLFSEDEAKQLRSIEHLIGRKLVHEVVAGFAPSNNKPPVNVSDVEEDVWGNFEPDTKPQGRGKPKGRGNHGGKTTNRKRNSR